MYLSDEEKEEELRRVFLEKKARERREYEDWLFDREARGIDNPSPDICKRCGKRPDAGLGICDQCREEVIGMSEHPVVKRYFKHNPFRARISNLDFVLHDVMEYPPAGVPGETQIWYWKIPEYTESKLDWYERCSFRGKNFQGNLPPTVSEVYRDYALLGTTPEIDPEHIFAFMQGENWSPRGEARPLIRTLGTGHTSMSIGDVIRLPDGKWLMADTFGFTRIGEV